MSRVICTFATGELFERMAAITYPRIDRYSRYHDFQWDCRDPENNSRPASWMKIPRILEYLRQGDEVLWVDADVYIKDYRYNIFEELDPYAFHGLVNHHVCHGNVPSYVPNCGVWVLRPPMIPYLETIWTYTQYLNHCNWEQAAFIKLIGGNPDSIEKSPLAHWPVSDKLEFHTTWLDYRWNMHPMDVRRFDASGYFWHCTMFRDRLKTLEEWDGEG